MGTRSKDSILQGERGEGLSLAFKAPPGGTEDSRGPKAGLTAHAAAGPDTNCRNLACLSSAGALAGRARPSLPIPLAPPLQPAVTSATTHLLPLLRPQPRHFINYSMIATKAIFHLMRLSFPEPGGARIVSIWQLGNRGPAPLCDAEVTQG